MYIILRYYSTVHLGILMRLNTRLAQVLVYPLYLYQVYALEMVER